MTQQEIDRMRKEAIIEGELKIIERIPNHHFSSVHSPDLLGGSILTESIKRIRKALAS